MGEGRWGRGGGRGRGGEGGGEEARRAGEGGPGGAGEGWGSKLVGGGRRGRGLPRRSAAVVSSSVWGLYLRGILFVCWKGLYFSRILSLCSVCSIYLSL